MDKGKHQEIQIGVIIQEVIQMTTQEDIPVMLLRMTAQKDIPVMLL